MEFILISLAMLLVFFGVVNLIRITAFLIGSDIYSLKRHLNKRKDLAFFPLVSVIIPAYHEENSIVSAVKSVIESNYPQNRIEVIVINDGSKDKTETVLRNYLNSKGISNILIVNQINSGKANALNNGMRNYSKGEVLMCLDADSYLDPDAIKNSVYYFEDPNVMALASNVKVAKAGGILNFIQQYEYLLSYQMKRAQTLFNIEYIIGGIGSMFRRSYLKEINFYDEDTVTEDIDLTMKILRAGNKKVRVVYGADVISYTQGVLNIRDLIKQRYRWKWGRYQTFLKNKYIFFTTKKTFTKSLTWFYLPFALFCDLAFLFEPLILSYIIYLVIFYKDFITLISTVSVISFYILMNILSEDTISYKDKLKMLPFIPFMYFLFYMLSYIEYAALIKSLINLPRLKESIHKGKTAWEPVTRMDYVN